MAVRIRLKRVGSKKKPYYRVVVADSKNPRDGRFVEDIGYYDPRANPARVSIKTDRALAWLKIGAKPSETVRSLLRKAGVMEGSDEADRGEYQTS